MRSVSILCLLALAAAGPALAKVKSRQPQQSPPQQIACTIVGCVPVPRGCKGVPNATYYGDYDIIICPPGVAPFR